MDTQINREEATLMATTIHGGTRRDGRRRTGRKVSTRDALRHLADKQVEPAYRSPRGNQELDEDALQHSLGKIELVLGG